MTECQRLLCHGSRSFHIASRFLPLPLRESASGLYAFCRVADDLVDLGGNPRAALTTLHHRLDQIYAGRPENHPVDRVLSQIVIDHRMPRGLLDALLEGFEWDAEGRNYETLSDVCDYGARVAGAVGVMMAILMGIKDHSSLARAADLGVAMQLTNICRDVGEDARAGRLYLPRALMREHGLEPEAFLHQPKPSAALSAVLRQLLLEADRRYVMADQGIRQLPRRCRPGILAARLLYSEIGKTVARNDYDCINRRAIVSGKRKCRILMRLFSNFSPAQELLLAPCAPENRFLIDTVPKTEEWQRDTHPRRFTASASWMLELFMVMEQRDEMTAQGQPVKHE